MKSSASSHSEPQYNIFTVTLSLPQDSERILSWNSNNSPIRRQHKIGQNHHDELVNKEKYRNDTKGLKRQWGSICDKWGMIVVRELVYIQNTILDDDLMLSSDTRSDASLDNTEKQNQNGSNILGIQQNSPSPFQNKDNIIIIDGCEAKKVRDQLVVSEVIQRPDDVNTSFTAAQNAGIQPGDIIHAIYGMKNPKLALLFGIMRDSVTFQYVFYVVFHYLFVVLCIVCDIIERVQCSQQFFSIF